MARVRILLSATAGIAFSAGAHADDIEIGCGGTVLVWLREHLILEYEIPKYDGDLGQSNFFMPLSRSTCQRKIEHIMKTFASQKERSWFWEETFWAMLRPRGIEANASYAEAFYAHKIVG